MTQRKDDELNARPLPSSSRLLYVACMHADVSIHCLSNARARAHTYTHTQGAGSGVGFEVGGGGCCRVTWPATAANWS